MRFVPSAIHSTPVSRKLPRLVDVLINSIKNMVLAKTNKSGINRLRLKDLSLFCYTNKQIFLQELKVSAILGMPARV